MFPWENFNPKPTPLVEVDFNYNFHIFVFFMKTWVENQQLLSRGHLCVFFFRIKSVGGKQNLLLRWHLCIFFCMEYFGGKQKPVIEVNSKCNPFDHLPVFLRLKLARRLQQSKCPRVESFFVAKELIFVKEIFYRKKCCKAKIKT